MQICFRWCFCILLLAVQLTNASGQEAAGPSLRILTYNIHHGQGTDGRFDYPRLAKVIKDLNPDLVALQEVDNKTQRAEAVDQAAHLAELVGMEHAFGRSMHFSGGEYGQAILSRFPIKKTWNHPLPYRAGKEPRSTIAVEVTPPEGLPKLIFAGTHLCHQSSETRLEQAQQLNIFYPSQSEQPILLCGDFNARSGSLPMQELLKERWVDAVAPKSRIDYVLYRQTDPWKVREVIIVPDDVTSDHRPVLVVLEWLRD